VHGDETVGVNTHFLKKTDNALSEIGSTAMFSELKDTTAPNILFYIHGFNCDEEEVQDCADNLQAAIDEYVPDLCTVVPMIWPSNGNLILTDEWESAYFSDQKINHISAPAFAHAVDKLAHYDTGKKLHIIAHSIGNQLLCDIMVNYRDNHVLDLDTLPKLFDSIFMIAADIPYQHLERGEEGADLAKMTDILGVYYASDDIALELSQLANCVARLGDDGCCDFSATAENVYQVNCDAINDSGIRHSYFGLGKNEEPSAAMRHFISVMCGARPSGNIVL
jgi:esterase/lipase superfamily enzyme